GPAVDGEAPDLGRGQVVGDLGHVLVDVDLERLDGARGDGRQSRVDLGELLEGDVARRRRGGGLGLGRGGRGGRLRGRLVDDGEDREDDGDERKQRGQAD